VKGSLRMKKLSLSAQVLGSLAAWSVLALPACAAKKEAEEPNLAIPGVILFTDGEGGDGKSLIAGDDGFVGGWYSYDGTKDCGLVLEGTGPETGDLNPPGSMFTFSAFSGVPSPGPEGEQSSNTKGVHFWAKNDHVAVPSAGAGVHLKTTPLFALPSNYVGIRFKAYSATGDKGVFVKLTDDLSEPAGMLCEQNPDDKCDNAKLKTAMKNQGCYDAAGANLKITSEWKEYRVYFNKTPANTGSGGVVLAGPFQRGGWGLKKDGTATTEPLHLDKIDQFQIQSGDKDPIDIWVDNIGFIVAGGPLDIP
jgi:hypothetical protein